MALLAAARTMALSTLLLATSVSHGFACAQGAAKYFDPLSGLELAFTSFRQELAIMHEFDLTSQRYEIDLNGYVLVGGEPLRPIALVQDNCPEGDVTGEELEACTVWEGVVYGAFDGGMIGLLPGAEEDAVRQILLPDFVQSFLTHEVGQKLPDGKMFEVFDFKECGDK